MRFISTLLLITLSSLLLPAQTIAGFENFNLPADTFLNNSGAAGGFASGNVVLPNTYVNDPLFPFWTDWAISTKADTLTPGVGNQYSAITGGGHDGSLTYAVASAFEPVVIRLMGVAAGGLVEGFYVTNTTYAYRSMLEGDAFAKRFGGETGNDPDFLVLTIHTSLGGQLSADSIDFYLADYRFADNNQDYILNEWTYVDLTGLGNADSLRLSLRSSDMGDFGINTPAYFAVDDIITTDLVAAGEPNEEIDVRLYPNPTADFLWVESTERVTLTLFDARGRNVMRQAELYNPQLDLRALPAGVYVLWVKTAGGLTTRQIVKQ